MEILTIHTGTTNLFKGLYIPTKFEYKNTVKTGTIFNNFDFGLPTDTDFTTTEDSLNPGNNKIINLHNQIMITLKITTENI